MKVFHDIVSYSAWRTSLPSSASVGFVPTMGALHAGHARLLEVSREQNTHTVLSIFVNPTQFGPNEDLSKYPRTLESDLKIAEAEGVAAVFVPTESMLYPDGYSTFVTEEKLSLPLCGVFRPGHFRGVATIVLKLFNIIEADHAYFGLKDAQQFFVIQKMARDLNVRIKLTGVETVREASGLALSSRNTYLSKEERTLTAPQFYQILISAKNEFQNGGVIAAVLESARGRLAQAGFQVQYLELRSTPELTDLTAMNILPKEMGAVLAGALFLGKVRLIDNIIW